MENNTATEEQRKESLRQEILAKLGITPQIQAANRAKAELAESERRSDDRRRKQVCAWVDDLQNP